MNKIKNDLLARFHQLMANDRNAVDIYQALSTSITNKDIADQFATLAKEEAGHLKMENELFRLIEEEPMA